MKTWLILDCNYLCHRAKYAMGDLSHGTKATGVIYGFLKTVFAMQKEFDTPYVVFCWDSKTSKRQEIYPDYKANRKDKFKNMDKDELEFEKNFRKQMKYLRKIYLPTIGYKNVFVQKGYEADDLIASTCLNLPKKDRGIIITSDEDMYQLITDRISFYSPAKHRTLTLTGFKKKYRIKPWLWSVMKAIAGCATDNIKGIKGVGEITALKYIRKELNKTTKVYKRIREESAGDIYWRNKDLVTLPFEGTKTFKLRKDKITKEGWRQVTKALGMDSIKDKPPIFKGRKALK